MNNNSSKQVLLSVIGVAILVVALVGVSFAFFNYSRTGTAVNQFQVGSIYFTASDDTISLDNAFPVATATVTDGTAAATDVDTLTVTITGNTTYADGLDFRITALPETTNTFTNASWIGVIVSEDEDNAGNANVTLKNKATHLNQSGNTVLCEGHIDAGDGITDYAITIQFYVDASLVLITDTEDDPGTQAIIGNRTAVTTDAWKNKVYSFKVNISAVQTGGTPAANY